MQTIKFKTIFSYIPEVSFLLMAFMWFMDNFKATPSHVNYYMIAIVVFVLVMMIWRIKVFALILSGALGIGSLFMLLAVFSEFREFPQGDSAGIKMLLIGSLIFLALAVMSVIMPMKYLKRKEDAESVMQYQ